MKKICVLMCLVSFVSASAQYWPPPKHTSPSWIEARHLQGPGNGDVCIEVEGWVGIPELDDRGLLSIGSGRPDYGYFFFNGVIESGPYGIPDLVFGWPPGLITPEYVWGEHNVFHIVDQWHNGFCNCDCLFPTPDTMYPGYAFGFWWQDPSYPPSFWLINHGYTVSTDLMILWTKIPCPPAGPWYGKDRLYFSDSLWNELPPAAVLSGDSRLYIKALPDVDLANLDVTLFLETSPEQAKIVHMTKVPDTREWHGSFTNSREVGLKSYNTAVAKTTYPGPDTTTWGRATVDVALPKILTQVDSVFTDTVFIRSDSMKVARDLKVSLRFYNDRDSQEVSAVSLVDTCGYKYKSLWIANSNLPVSQQKKYYRQFPGDTLTYRMWNDTTPDCQVSFNRDSLYVIGGKLTMVCKGKLRPVPDMDNSFLVNTDTLSVEGDTLRTRLILIDRDPINLSFKTRLGTDRARAIAWEEYAGSADPTHCRNPYNVRWNHYWDDRINGADTCRDTKTPCENATDTTAKDTGIMQIFRTTWESTFDSTAHFGEYPMTFQVCKWDSLAWSWQINIRNGRWIFQEAMRHKMLPEQWAFPESCSFARCDSVPDSTNREDLGNYGYHAGEGNMRRIKSQKLWNDYINNPTVADEVQRANYIKRVRRYKYRGNLW